MSQRNRSIHPLVRATVAASCLAVLRSTSVAAQKPFEGVITAESYVNRTTQVETLFVKGKRWRLNGVEQGRAQRDGAIVNNDKGQILLFMPSRRVYMPQPVAADADQAANLVTFTKLGKSESVAGAPCDYYKVQFGNSAAMDREFCVATDIGSAWFTPEVRVHEGLASLAIAVVARKKFPAGFVVLKAIDKNGKVVFAATKVDRHSLSNDLFEPGVGWNEAPTGGRPPGRPRL